MKIQIARLSLAALLATATATVAGAQAPSEIDIHEAIRIALERVPGTAQSADLEIKLGRKVFEVEILSTKGPEYEVVVDAHSGEVLQSKLDD